MLALTIVPMRASDIDAVIEIELGSHRPSWPPQVFLGELERDWAHVDVVRSSAPGSTGTRVLGFCNYWLVNDEAQLLNLATHPAWRRHGIGTLLMQHLIAVAHGRGCTTVTLEVRASNHAAQALYRRHGFESVGIRPRYYADDGEDALVMTLELDTGRA